MAHLTGSLHLFFSQCANYCTERGKTVIYCILVQQTAKLKTIWKEIMFHVNSKSDKKCNRQGSTISFPKIIRPPMGTLLIMWMVSPYLTPPLLRLLLPTCPLGPWICPALLPLSFQTFLPSWSSKQASSSFPYDHSHFIAHPSCSGLALVKKLNPLECFVDTQNRVVRGSMLVVPRVFECLLFCLFPEIYWSNKSSAMMEKN